MPCWANIRVEFTPQGRHEIELQIRHPSLVAIGLTASVALAQAPGPQRGNRTPPTAEQMAARQTQMCADRHARGDAQLTYMEERLALTAAQKPLFERWKAAMQSEDAARQADCAKPRPRRPRTHSAPPCPSAMQGWKTC